MTASQPFTTEPLTSQTRGSIVKGFHDIFPYVHRFWAIHLTESIREGPTTTPEGDNAKKEIHHLLLALMRAFQENEVRNEHHTSSTTGTIYGQVLSLGDLPGPILRYLDFQGRWENPNSITASPNPPLKIQPEDPILLDFAFTRFRESFEALLADDSPTLDSELGVSPAELLDFRTRHSSSAYLCRWRGCLWSSTGFQSSAQRSRHEARHEKRFRCNDPTCDFAEEGFTSQAVLRKHRETYHTSLDEIVLPPFPGRKALPRAPNPAEPESRDTGRPGSGSIKSSEFSTNSVSPDPRYDGERRLWKDGMMPHNAFEVRMTLPDGKNYVTDLDVKPLERAAAFHNTAQEGNALWMPQLDESFGDARKKSGLSDPGWSRSPRILLVEDDPTCRMIGNRFLHSFSCVVDCALDGVEAVSKMQEGLIYDMILMDIVMPKLDGVSACHLIRQFDSTLIIAMTSSIRADDLHMYFQHGMDDVLVKPFTRKSLLDLLEKHLMHLKNFSNARSNGS